MEPVSLKLQYTSESPGVLFKHADPRLHLRLG